MNKIVASLGVVVLGASSLPTASAQDFDAPPSKLWNATASLRGFYDDNPSTAPSGPNKNDTFGWEISPGVGLNWENEATKVRLGYRYAAKYFSSKPENYAEKYTQDHTFDGALDHAISERFKVGVTDSFVIGQEPDALRVGPTATTQNIPGNNIRNYGTITFDAQITRLFSLQLGYGNSYFDYADDFSDSKNVDAADNIIPSNSGSLDRIENRANIDARWLLAPETTGLVGAEFQQVNYTADEAIAGNITDPTTILMSDERDRRSYIGYLGADHRFSPNLSGSARVGVQFNDYFNSPNGNSSDVSPYVRLSGQYVYAPESMVSLGFSQSRSATDVTGQSRDSYVRDTDVSLVYGSIRHRIVPRVYGSLTGSFQNMIYNGHNTSLDGKASQYYALGLNLEYKFNPFLSFDAGYNYDRLDSEVTAEYDRNRVYIGVTASY
ncbi:MAG: outer membrane beta-barrel protein [Verrucomicrobiota bacterium]